MTRADLILALRAASGPDRDLDLEICKAFGIIEVRWIEGRDTDEGYGKLDWPISDKLSYLGCEGQYKWEGYPAFTASVDAALALVERLLPGTRYSVGTLPNELSDKPWCMLCCEEVCRRLPGGWGSASAQGATAPLAILLALFLALESRDAQT